MEAETGVHNELAEIRWFAEYDKWFGEKALGHESEERMWKPSLRIHLRWWWLYIGFG